MSNENLLHFRPFEGRTISIALADGSRIDDCQLISAGRHGVASLWVFVSGVDTFIPASQVIAVWESGTPVIRRHRVA